MEELIKNRVSKFLSESIRNSSSEEWNICDDFSVDNYDDLISLLKKSHIEQKDWDNIQGLLDELKTGLSKSSNDEDQLNTITHKIASKLCK